MKLKEMKPSDAAAFEEKKKKKKRRYDPSNIQMPEEQMMEPNISINPQMNSLGPTHPLVNSMASANPLVNSLASMPV